MILKEVSHKEDGVFLYDLLRERDDTVNISHKNIPEYRDHIKFIKSKPYYSWYIIFNDKYEKIGTVYITRKENLAGRCIGIQIKKEFIGNGYAKKAVNLLLKIYKDTERILANISPKNKKSEEFFSSLGFKKIQHTYEYQG